MPTTAKNTDALHDLAAKVPASIGTQVAYGEQVDLDGTKIIPVAYAAFGFGAGEGTDKGGSQGGTEGSGGGGGGVSIPVGAYISRHGNVRFEPNLIALLVVGVPFVWVAGRALARVVRALKR